MINILIEAINIRVFQFMISNCLKKYNDIWDNVKNLFEIEFDNKPVNNNKYIKTKTKRWNK